MGLWQTLVGKLAGTTIQQQVDVRVKESLQLAGFLQEDWGWTRISEGRSTRDLQPLHHEQMIALALYAYDRNPLGKWTLEMTRDLICAEGITVASEDDAVSDVLKAFWDFPINNLDIQLPQMVLELGLYGEQCWPVFAGEHGGTMSLGLVDPADILKVIHDPDNCAVPIGICLKDRGEGEGPKFRVIYDRPDEELFAEKARQMRDEQFTDGETFWWTINGVRSATRGRSDLFALLDWLDGYEKFLLYTLDRTALLNAFAWDVTLEGMDPAEVAAWLKANPRPDPGAWFAHNERVKLNAITPNLGGADAADHGRMIRNHILGASFFPEHWMGGGGDVNRACYDDQTETLTATGWKSYDAINPDTLIAQYNPDTDRLEWVPAGPIYLYDYTGDMLHFKNQVTDIMVTPDHRMYAKKHNQRRPHLERYAIYTAQELASWSGQERRWTLLHNAPWDAADLEVVDLPAVRADLDSRAILPPLAIPADTFIEFLGYWLAEGHTRSRNNPKRGYELGLSQKNPAKAETIRKCLAKLSAFTWYERTEPDGTVRWTTSDKALYLWLREHCGTISPTRRFPDFARHLSLRQSRLLFESLMLGDGTNHNERATATPNQQHRTYFSTSKALIDDVQVLVLRLGFRTSIWQDARPGKSPIYHLHLSPNRRESQIRPRQIQPVPYSGKVYCFRVPSGLFVTRRNSKVAIQGNTAAEMGTPTFKHYQTRQRLVKYIIERLCHHQLALAREAGTLGTDDLAFTVNMPQMVTQDLSGIFSALMQLTSAAQIAEDRGWIDAGTSQRLFSALASRSGVEVPVDAEAAQAEAHVTPDYRQNGHAPGSTTGGTGVAAR